MLLGIVVDDRGLVPDAEVKHMKEFGQLIGKYFSNPILYCIEFLK
jgi:alpha-L-fucosidase